MAGAATMPKSSDRIYQTQRLRISKVVEAPLKFVYQWCTDFRDDDGKLSTSKPRFKTLRPAPDRVLRIRLSNAKAGTPDIAVDLVRLMPPNAWHVDQIDETDLAAVDYRLSPHGPNKTRVTLDITERWMTPRHPDRREYLESTGHYWDRLVAAIEKRYRSGQPARE